MRSKYCQWTPEKDELILMLWKDGMTADEISKQPQILTTRNAIIGRLNRIGAPKRPPIEAKASYIRRRSPPIPLPTLIPDAPQAEPTQMVMLKARECRWPIAGPSGHLFCSALVLGKGHSYCEYHHKMAHQ